MGFLHIIHLLQSKKSDYKSCSLLTFYVDRLVGTVNSKFCARILFSQNLVNAKFIRIKPLEMAKSRL